MNIWLVGGEKVIPTSVEKAIQGDGYTVKRISGEDRYETAAAIAEAGIKLSGKKPSKVFVASGTSFADALAVSPVAYGKGYPIILTEKDSTSDFSKKELGNIGTDAKILVGGEAVVSKKVAADLSIKEDARVAGDDRAVTANKVADWAKKYEGFNPANAALVGGTNGNGADSLVASALGAKSFTTLHFAGWDATNVYLKDHAAELTGKGFVFGGKAAVSEGDVSKAQSAAQTVVSNQSFIVTSVGNKAAGEFVYANSAENKAVTATFGTTDSFMVGGTSATIATFRAALSVGDTVEVLANTPEKGKTTYKLVNKEEADYTSGLIGGSLSGTQLQVVEPVTGQPLSTVTTTGDYTLYTVDGSAVSLALFNGALSAGDTVKISGGGSSASDIRTIALTNVTVKGKVTELSGAAFSIDTGKGAPIGPFTSVVNTDALTVDGTTKVKADFDAALSNGDTVSFSKNGGVQTIALTNAAPPLMVGQVSGAETIVAGQLVAVPYVPEGKAAAVAAPLQITVTPDVTNLGSGSATEVQELELAAVPFGKVKKLSLEYAGSGISQLDGQIVTVDVPSTGSASADATTLASRIDAGITALGGGAIVTDVNVVATSSTVYTITYGADGAVNDIAGAVALTPLDVTVDGSVATAAEAATALTAGDSVKYQEGDLQTKTASRLEITNAKYAGAVKASTVDITGPGVSVEVYAAGSTTDTLGSVDYTSASAGGLTTGTSANYVVNGSASTTNAAAFESALSSIKNGVLKGSLTISQSDTKTIYTLTTTNA